MSEVLALACVVDSSYALASEWRQTLQSYIIPLLRRLTEMHSGRTFLIGFVSYATAETRPTPLLSKLFFGHPQYILKDLQDDPKKLGIGITGSGGSTGMAALEGLVAAVELFDTLRNSMEALACHIVHIAAAPPDTASRPLWNVAPALDAVSWDTLPLELQKRKISYSNILLKQLPRLAELHSQAAAGSSQNPWFTVRPHHALHLAGFPTTQQKGVKRLAEAAPTERIQEKRSRVEPQPTQISSKPAQPTPQPVAPVPDPPAPAPAPVSASVPAASSSVVASPAAAAPVSAAVPAQHASQLPRPNAEQLQAMDRRVQAFRSQLEQKLQQMNEAQNAGRVEESNTLRAQIQNAMPQFQKMKLYYQALQHAAGNGADGTRPASMPGVNAGPQAGPSNRQLPSSTTQSVDLASATHVEDPSSSDPATQPTMPQPRPFAQPTQHTLHANGAMGAQQLAHGVPMPTSVSPPQIAAQMQKLIEQQRSRAQQPSQLQSAPPPQMPPERTSVPGGAGPQPSGQGGPVLLHRTLICQGFDRERPGDISINVTVQVASNQDHWRPEFWPTRMTVQPSQRPSVPWEVLQDWLKDEHAIVMLIMPNSEQPAEQEVNNTNLGRVQRAMMQNFVYGVASCEGPSGVLERRLLIFPFPMRPNTLGAAFFMTAGGMRDWPNAVICGFELKSIPQHLARMLAKIPPEQDAQLQKMPLDMRLAWLSKFSQAARTVAEQQQVRQQAQLLQLRQFQQQQQQHMPHVPSQPRQQPIVQQRPPSIPNANPPIMAPSFFSGPGGQGQVGGLQMTAFGNAAPQPNTMGMNYNPMMQMQNVSMPSGMHQRTPSGGVSFEMLHAFMQRTQEGMGGGMGS